MGYTDPAHVQRLPSSLTQALGSLQHRKMNPEIAIQAFPPSCIMRVSNRGDSTRSKNTPQPTTLEHTRIKPAPRCCETCLQTVAHGRSYLARWMEFRFSCRMEHIDLVVGWNMKTNHDGNKPCCNRRTELSSSRQHAWSKPFHGSINSYRRNASPSNAP